MPYTPSTAVPLTLQTFNYDFSMALATVEAEQALDMSGVLARIDLPVSTARDVFRFYTDSTQDLSSELLTDIRYYVRSANKTAFKNPCTDSIMCLEKTEIQGISLVNAEPSVSVYVVDSAGRSYVSQGQNAVKHDFLRHVAKGLFNTEYGVDLFSNEATLLSDLHTKGELVFSHIKAKIEAVDTTNAAYGPDFSGNKYSLSNTDTSDNLTMELMSQMFQNATAKTRFQELETNCPIAADMTRPLPFVAGDSIS